MLLLSPIYDCNFHINNILKTIFCLIFRLLCMIILELFNSSNRNMDPNTLLRFIDARIDGASFNLILQQSNFDAKAPSIAEFLRFLMYAKVKYRSSHEMSHSYATFNLVTMKF